MFVCFCFLLFHVHIESLKQNLFLRQRLMPYRYYRFLNNPLLVLSTQEAFRKTFVGGRRVVNEWILDRIRSISLIQSCFTFSMGIRSERCAFRQFCCCADITEPPDASLGAQPATVIVCAALASAGRAGVCRHRHRHKHASTASSRDLAAPTASLAMGVF